MVKKAKGKHRLDKFYHLAKEQGYRSRAAFKLIQLNRQFHFLDRARTCLDLCAAPGGWMQVAVKTMPMNSLVIGIDLDPIKPIKGAQGLVGDITTAKARSAIKKEANGSMMEVVLHDGAPNVGGVWASEAYSQSSLVLEALRLATDTLVPNGVFVTKIFRSQDYNALLYAFKQLFNKVEATKPAASRNTSAEIFVVCQGYKAPAKIDPRLLDPKHLFQEVTEAPKVMGPDALLKQKIKQKRFRDGYAEGLSSLHKQTTAAAFIASENPVEMLGQYTRFVLEDPAEEQAETDGKDITQIAEFVRSHAATNTEIRTLLADLQVLGRSEFKLLLKWRLKIKKELAAAAAANIKDEDTQEDTEPAEEKDPETVLLEEMQEVQQQAAQRQKREKKRRMENKKKSRVRSAQLAMGEGIAEDNGPEPLFSLASMRGSVKAADIGDDAEIPDDDVFEDSGDDDALDANASEGEYDSDEERRRYEAEQEEAMEEAYQGYLERQGQRAKAARAKRARLGKTGDLDSENDVQSNDEEEQPLPQLQDEPEVGGGLLVELDQTVGRAKTPAAVAAQWFSQDLFAGAEEEDAEVEAAAPAKKRLKVEQPNAAARTATAEAAGAAEVMVPKATPGLEKEVRKTKGARPEETADFDEVPASESDATSVGTSDSEMEQPDEQTAAELRAYAKAMLNGRTRSDILDAAYHRYAFHDDGLPRWFAEDERRHMRPPAVVSKDEIEAEKLRFRAIDARPIKKVAEAKARKKKRLQVRLEAARSRATSIAEQGDLSDRAKAKEVEKLYAKAKAGGTTKKKPTRSDKFKKKKGPPLDKRLYSDKRQVHNKAKKKAAKTRKKKGGGGAKGKGGAAKAR